MPAKLPSPTADPDALAGINTKPTNAAAAAAAGGGYAADGLEESVLEGAGGSRLPGGASDDEYDRNDSFLADSGALFPGFRAICISAAADVQAQHCLFPYVLPPHLLPTPPSPPWYIQAPSTTAAAAGAAAAALAVAMARCLAWTCLSRRSKCSLVPLRWVREWGGV